MNMYIYIFTDISHSVHIMKDFYLQRELKEYAAVDEIKRHLKLYQNYICNVNCKRLLKLLHRPNGV